MTETQEETPVRRTATVPLAGKQFHVQELVDLQKIHLATYARILTRDDVSGLDKHEAAQKMLSILHRVIPDPKERSVLVDLEESGDVSLQDLIVFSQAFRDQEEQEVTAPVVVKRRGRPRKSA